MELTDQEREKLKGYLKSNLKVLIFRESAFDPGYGYGGEDDTITIKIILEGETISESSV